MPPEDREAKKRLFAIEPPSPLYGLPNLSAPEQLLDLDGNELATRLSGYAVDISVTWKAERAGKTISSNEHHRVQQPALTAFELSSRVDPGEGPSNLRGRYVIFLGGKTYARSEFGPWRERASDRGRDAGRYRNELLSLLGSVTKLCGPALSWHREGSVTVLGRNTVHFSAVFKDSISGSTPAAAAATSAVGGPVFPKGGPDNDTRQRLRFLTKAHPTAVSGELFLDQQTGAPLKARLRASLRVRDDSSVRIDIELAQSFTALGNRVEAVLPPPGALSDAHKARGVARALEAVGLGIKQTSEAEKGDSAEHVLEDAEQ